MIIQITLLLLYVLIYLFQYRNCNYSNMKELSISIVWWIIFMITAALLGLSVSHGLFTIPINDLTKGIFFIFLSMDVWFCILHSFLSSSVLEYKKNRKDIHKMDYAIISFLNIIILAITHLWTAYDYVSADRVTNFFFFVLYLCSSILFIHQKLFIQEKGNGVFVDLIYFAIWLLNWLMLVVQLTCLVTRLVSFNFVYNPLHKIELLFCINWVFPLVLFIWNAGKYFIKKNRDD